MNKNSDIKISFFNLIKTISDSIDLRSVKITGHHKLVAYISLQLGLRLNLDKASLRKLVFSALIHDIGILYFDKRIDDILDNRTNEEHAYVGYALIKDYFPFDGYSQILKNHHNKWNKIEHNMNNYLSNIINLADITAYFTDEKSNNILSQKAEIIKTIKQYAEEKISPDILNVIDILGHKEAFWFDMVSIKNREQMVEEYIRKNLDLKLNLDQVLSISEIVSHIIDFRSPFTAAHSKGIATISAELAGNLGFSDEDIKIMEIAGYFHDIGKMAWPLRIINKTGKLSKKDWAVVKSHTYYTYYVLDNIKEIPKLKEWAAYHHETLDGKGYPFKIDKRKINMGARIVAVADIFTAIAEDRPYRNGFKKKKIINILKELAINKKIDESIVKVLIEDFDRYNVLRREKQKKAICDYNNFEERTIKEIELIYATV